MRDGFAPPSAAAAALAAEMESNVATLVRMVPPSALVQPSLRQQQQPGDARLDGGTRQEQEQQAVPRLRTFVDTSRSMGLLRLPCDLPPVDEPPAPEDADYQQRPCVPGTLGIDGQQQQQQQRPFVRGTLGADRQQQQQLQMRLQTPLSSETRLPSGAGWTDGQGDQCARSDGKGWRCHATAVLGFTLCATHRTKTSSPAQHAGGVLGGMSSDYFIAPARHSQPSVPAADWQGGAASAPADQSRAAISTIGQSEATDGTPFTVHPLTGQLHYPGLCAHIPKGDDRITLFSPSTGAPPGFQWSRVKHSHTHPMDPNKVRSLNPEP